MQLFTLTSAVCNPEHSLCCSRFPHNALGFQSVEALSLFFEPSDSCDRKHVCIMSSPLMKRHFDMTLDYVLLSASELPEGSSHSHTTNGNNYTQTDIRRSVGLNYSLPRLIVSSEIEGISSANCFVLICKSQSESSPLKWILITKNTF